MSKFFYNRADKNACFLINCKILVTRATEKQTLLLAGYKHNQWKVPAILLFYKKINSATWKEQKD